MKKVLIIGLGFRGENYIKYFFKNNYEVSGVCKTLKTKLSIESKYNIKVSNDLDKSIEIAYKYDIVVFALSTDVQCDIILKNTNLFKSVDKIFLELPVSYNQSIIERLKKYDNIYFFIEEYVTNFAKFLRKIEISSIEKMKISIYMNKEDKSLYNNKIIHIKCNFIGTNFNFDSTTIELIYGKEYNNKDLNYEINFNYKGIEVFYKFSHNGVSFKLGDKYINSPWSFDININLLLSLDNNKFIQYYNIDKILK